MLTSANIPGTQIFLQVFADNSNYYVKTHVAGGRQWRGERKKPAYRTWWACGKQLLSRAAGMKISTSKSEAAKLPITG